MISSTPQIFSMGNFLVPFLLAQYEKLGKSSMQDPAKFLSLFFFFSFLFATVFLCIETDLLSEKLEDVKFYKI